MVRRRERGLDGTVGLLYSKILHTWIQLVKKVAIVLNSSRFIFLPFF